MGMNVTGVNSYATNALPTTAPKYTSQVQSSLLSQPAYDTVSFSGNYQTQKEEKQGMSTAAKVGIVATAAAVVVGIWAASRGKKVNAELGKEAAGLVDNIGAGLKSIFTKAGRESYKAIAQNSDKLDDLGKGVIDASGKAKPSREVTSNMLEAANKKGVAAQEEVNKLQASLKELEASRAELIQNSGTNGDGVKDLDDKIKKLTDQITEKQKSANSAFKEVAELKFDKNMADDVDYAQLLKTKQNCGTQLTELRSKETTLQKEIAGLKTQREQLAKEIADLKQSNGNGAVSDLIRQKQSQQASLLDSFNKKNKELKELSTKVTEAAQSSKYAVRDLNAYTSAKKGYYFGEAQEGIHKTILENYQKGLDTAAQSGSQQKMLEMLQGNVDASWNGSSAGSLNRKTAWEQVKEMIFGNK